VLARALSGDIVHRCAADLEGFRFQDIVNMSDKNLLTGAMKYGGLDRLAALCAPGELLLHNLPAAGIGDWAPAAYKTAGSGQHLEMSAPAMPADKVLAWLTR
jgi:hypothetical protein